MLCWECPEHLNIFMGVSFLARQLNETLQTDLCVISISSYASDFIDNYNRTCLIPGVTQKERMFFK